MAKRGQGEGTISKREDGTWWARITLGKDESGKQKRKAFYGKTRKEVQEKLTTALNEVNNETYIEPSKMTISEWMDVWLKEYKKNSLKTGTYLTYERHIRIHIKPMLGSIRLKDIRKDIVQKFVNDLVAKDLSSKLVKNIYTILQGGILQAVSIDLVGRNAVHKISLPKNIRKKEITILSLDEQKSFIAEAKRVYQGEMFILILATGLRIGDG